MLFGIPYLNLLVFIAAAIGFVRTIDQIRHSFIHIRQKLLWLIVWFVVGLTALYPTWLDALLLFTGWRDRMNVALVIAVLGLLALNFRMFARLEQLELKLAKSVEELVLRDHKPRRPQKSDKRDKRTGKVSAKSSSK